MSDTENADKGDRDGEYQELCNAANEIAKPMASRKLAKKLYKLVKKASKEKTFIFQGISDVQRALRKGQTGLMILAGDVTPIDIYCHIPIVCEDKEIPYTFTPSREHLGLAGGHKRPTIMVLIKSHPSYAALYDECVEAVKLQVE